MAVIYKLTEEDLGTGLGQVLLLMQETGWSSALALFTPEMARKIEGLPDELVEQALDEADWSEPDIAVELVLDEDSYLFGEIMELADDLDELRTRSREA